MYSVVGRAAAPSAGVRRLARAVRLCSAGAGSGRTPPPAGDKSVKPEVLDWTEPHPEAAVRVKARAKKEGVVKLSETVLVRRAKREANRLARGTQPFHHDENNLELEGKEGFQGVMQAREDYLKKQLESGRLVEIVKARLSNFAVFWLPLILGIWSLYNYNYAQRYVAYQGDEMGFFVTLYKAVLWDFLWIECVGVWYDGWDTWTKWYQKHFVPSVYYR